MQLQVTTLLLCLIASFQNISPAFAKSHELNTPIGNIVGLSVDQKHEHIYALDSTANQLVVIKNDGEALKRIKLANGAQYLSISPNSQFLGVICATQGFDYWRQPARGLLYSIDLENLKIKAQYDVGIDPWDIVVLDTGFAYIASGSNQWTESNVYDLKNGEMLGMFHFFRMQGYISANPSQKMMYSVSHEAGVGSWCIKEGRDQSLGGICGGYGGDPVDGRLVVNADGTRAIATNGTVIEVSPSPSNSAMGMIHHFNNTFYALVASPNPSIIFGFKETGELLFIDVKTFQIRQGDGYDAKALGAATSAVLLPATKQIIVATNKNKLIAVEYTD